jgi:hypothetical protein
VTCQPVLPEIDWSDVCPDADPDDDIAPRDRDLHGQGLTAVQLHTMTDVPLVGEYL